MRPRVIRSENFAPLTVTRAMLHEAARRYLVGAIEIAGIGHLPCMWCVAAGSSVAWIETPWESSSEKRMHQHVMRDLMHEAGADAYAVITEAWVAKIDGVDDKEAQRRMAFANKHGVSALPADQRADAVVLMSFDKAGGSKCTSYSVREQDGKVILGEPFDLGHGGGPMWNLLLPPERAKH